MRRLILIAALPLAACGIGDRGTGNDATAASSDAKAQRDFAVADFTNVVLAGPDDVEVRVGSAYSVRAEGPADVLDRLDIHGSGATLSIGRQRTSGVWKSEGRGVRVIVTMPAITAASLTGSGNLTVDRVAGGDFAASIEGSGDLKLRQVAANALSLDIQGSGDIEVSGEAKTLAVKIAGSGNVEGDDLKAGGATILVAGSGNVEAQVTGDATGNLMGSGDVTLGKGARCKVNKAGSGEVDCG
ncbi:head GIN domain-containing protein [Sphingomonas sp. RS2018]